MHSGVPFGEGLALKASGAMEGWRCGDGERLRSYEVVGAGSTKEIKMQKRAEKSRVLRVATRRNTWQKRDANLPARFLLVSLIIFLSSWASQNYPLFLCVFLIQLITLSWKKNTRWKISARFIYLIRSSQLQTHYSEGICNKRMHKLRHLFEDIENKALFDVIHY